MTREEEQLLTVQFQAGDVQAGHRIIEAHLAFVWSVALRLKRRCVHIEVEDLVQVGAVHLIHSLRSYTAGGNARFLSYCGDTLIHKMLCALLENRTIRIPRNALDGEGTKAAADQARNLATFGGLALDDREFIDGLAAAGEDGQAPEDIVVRVEEQDLARANLKRALHACLPDRWRQAIELRLEDEETTLREIGEVMGVTKQRVEQMLKKSMEQLDEYFATRVSESPEHVLGVLEEMACS